MSALAICVVNGKTPTKFSERNKSRLTWLQVFGRAGARAEQKALLLAGVSFQDDGADGPRVQIMLGGYSRVGPGRLTRVVRGVERVTKVGLEGRDEALVVVNNHGEVNLLRFEA